MSEQKNHDGFKFFGGLFLVLLCIYLGGWHGIIGGFL